MAQQMHPLGTELPATSGTLVVLAIWLAAGQMAGPLAAQAAQAAQQLTHLGAMVALVEKPSSECAPIASRPAGQAVGCD